MASFPVVCPSSRNSTRPTTSALLMYCTGALFPCGCDLLSEPIGGLPRPPWWCTVLATGSLMLCNFTFYFLTWVLDDFMLHFRVCLLFFLNFRNSIGSKIFY